MQNENAVTGQKSNLEVLLSEFVEELQRPLDPRALSVFSQCADRICHREPSSAPVPQAVASCVPDNLTADQDQTKS